MEILEILLYNKPIIPEDAEEKNEIHGFDF